MTEGEEIPITTAQTEDAAAQETTFLEDASERVEPELSDVLDSGETETVQSSEDAYYDRMDRVEREIQDVAEALLSQIAELEKQNQEALIAVEAQAGQRLNALEARIEAAEGARQEAEKRVIDAEAQVVQERRKQDVYKQAWQSAPLTLRLKFVRELLPESHALQNVLKEAVALEELRRRGRDLETWLSNYPALFAEAAQALLSEGIAQASDNDILETHPAEILAVQTLQETRTTLESTLQALGIAWVAPAPGDPILAEHEVIGEESSLQTTGCVARLRRRGFRFQGRLALPAQVLRATASAERTKAAEAPPAVTSAGESGGVLPPGHTPSAPVSAESESGSGPEAGEFGTIQHKSGETPEAGTEVHVGAASHIDAEDAGGLPDWLRMLSQRTFGCEIPAVSLLAEQLFALKELPVRIATESEEEVCRLLTSALTPLLPLLGLRYEDGLPGIPAAWGAVFLEARQPLLAWMEARMALSLVAPARGDAFDARTMEALETRRTVHAKEDETVAKLERIGVVWRAHPLFRAQVVRYTTGGSA